MKIMCKIPEAVVKRALFLAYQNSRPVGMGFLQARDGATEETVWEGTVGRADYGGVGTEKPGAVNADYVFGRMMKLRLKWDAEGVEADDSPARPDYQSWSHAYPTAADLVRAAVNELG